MGLGPGHCESAAWEQKRDEELRQKYVFWSKPLLGRLGLCSRAPETVRFTPRRGAATRLFLEEPRGHRPQLLKSERDRLKDNLRESRASCGASKQE